MSRTWMVWSAVLLAGAMIVVTGCQKDDPVTPDETIEVVQEPPPPPVEVAPPPPPAPADPVEKPWFEDKDLRTLNDEAIRRGFQPNVHFALDSAELNEDAREKLEQNARFLRENPSLRVNIEGHCDERGTNEYNLALGEKRASSAMSFVASLGVEASRMRTISYGEERPVCTESDESCWWRNRRAYFVLTVADSGY